MKTTINYIICTTLLAVAVVLTCNDNPSTALAGLCFDLCLYLSGLFCTKMWRLYWITNYRILNAIGVFSQQKTKKSC